MTLWLYDFAKKHMSKHNRPYSSYQIDTGSEAFKRAFVTHRKTLTTPVKRTLKTIDCDGREKKEMLKEDRSGDKCDVVPSQQLLHT